MSTQNVLDEFRDILEKEKIDQNLADLEPRIHS